jgi:RHS repeat-associated protein
VLKELPIYGSSRLGVYKVPAAGLLTERNKLTLGRREYEISNHLGNVLAVVSDVKLPAAKVLSHTDYYAFGLAMPGRSWQSAAYRYGFNGKEKAGEVAAGITDFGARLYNEALGRWMAVDPMAGKYPALSPYAGMDNKPTAFVDYDGEDFGIRVNHTTRTIIIVANVYTVSANSFQQAQAAAAAWNAKTANIDGYNVSFQINVIQPPVPPTNDEVINSFPDSRADFYKKDGSLKISKIEKNRPVVNRSNVKNAAEADPIGNGYAGGGEGWNSRNIQASATSFAAGVAAMDYLVSMNNYGTQDMGTYANLVTHEFGHLLGLDDAGGRYYSAGGIMQYTGTAANNFTLLPISDNDVRQVINYARDYLRSSQNIQAPPLSCLMSEAFPRPKTTLCGLIVV